jgi:hypothetical protein
VELHELGVADPGAGLHGEAEGVPGVLVPTGRGAAPDPRVPAGGEDDGVRVDDVPGAVDQVEAVGAEDHPVGDEELGDVRRREDGDVQLGGPTDERPLHRQARVVADEGSTPVRVRTEVALADPSVVLPVEVHAVALEVVDAAGGALDDRLHDPGVGEQVALLERVGGVLLPAVLRVRRRQRGVDPAGGQ